MGKVIADFDDGRPGFCPIQDLSTDIKEMPMGSI